MPLLPTLHAITSMPLENVTTYATYGDPHTHTPAAWEAFVSHRQLAFLAEYEAHTKQPLPENPHCIDIIEWGAQGDIVSKAAAKAAVTKAARATKQSVPRTVAPQSRKPSPAASPIARTMSTAGAGLLAPSTGATAWAAPPWWNPKETPASVQGPASGYQHTPGEYSSPKPVNPSHLGAASRVYATAGHIDAGEDVEGSLRELLGEGWSDTAAPRPRRGRGARR
jgi:hypothetical protein